MKRLLLAGLLLLAAALSDRSMAADMSYKAPSTPMPQWSWTEFYFGINIGYAYGQTSWCTDANAPNCLGPAPTDIYSPRPSGIIDGGEFGYRWQIPNTPAVIGLEADLSGIDINTSGAGIPAPAILTRYTQFNNIGAVDGTLGFAMGRMLAYGKGGWATTELNLDADNTLTGADVSTWKWVQGWNAGVGLEYMLFTHFSVGLEYTYYQFDVGNITGLTNTLGATIPCAFCNFGRTNVQAVVGRINLKLWPWGP
jgi:outer membrane immunogenic protein